MNCRRCSSGSLPPINRRVERRSAPGEDLSVVSERFEFQRIPGRVKKEHRVLLADFTLKAEMGLDDKRQTMSGQRVGETSKICWGQQDSEVGDGHRVAVHGISASHPTPSGYLMDDQLMAKHVEVNPGIGGAPLSETKNVSVEGSAGSKVIDREREMKAVFGHGHCVELAWVVAQDRTSQVQAESAVSA